MSMVTYPLNGIEYTAEDAELFHVTRTSGVYAKNSFDYSVTGADNTIVIGTGIGWIKNSEFSGKVIAQKEPVSVDLGLPDSVYPRIDSVVIKFDANSNGSNIFVKNGVPSSNPVAPPVVRTESVYELHLYHILRNAGALTISASNITDLRLNPNYCGLMVESITNIGADSEDKKFEMHLLWENASPTSAFAAQTIKMTLDANDSVMIQAGNAGENIVQCEMICPVGKTMALNATAGTQQAGLGEVQSAVRGVTVTTTGVVFQGGRAGVSSFADVNQAMVPFRIYGIKMGGGSAEGVLPAAEGVSF